MAFLKLSMVSTFLVLIMFLCYNLQPSTFVRADDELIHRVCHTTDEPTACNQCVKADNRSDNADRVGIATIVVDCMKVQAVYLQSNISALASKYKDDFAANQTIKKCQEWFSHAKADLSAATQGLKTGDYDAPTACNQCFKANNRSKNGTTVGIATIVSDCLDFQGVYLRSNISALDFSANQTMEPSSDLSAATQGFKTGDYNAQPRKQMPEGESPPRKSKAPTYTPTATRSASKEDNKGMPEQESPPRNNMAPTASPHKKEGRSTKDKIIIGVLSTAIILCFLFGLYKYCLRITGRAAKQSSTVKPV